MVATDLTEQKRNDMLLAAGKLERAILEQAADAILICDETGRIIRASKEAHPFYGKDLLGELFEHAFPLRHMDGTSFSLVGAMDMNRPNSAEARLEHDGKCFDFQVSVGHLKGARSELLGSVVTLTDITERKATEQALAQSSKDQIRFKDEFLSHVSHELRSPLTAIKQFSSILLDGLAGELNKEQRHYEEIVLKNIGQLQSMIDDLLEVTIRSAGRSTSQNQARSP